jgi:hypothetical protein
VALEFSGGNIKSEQVNVAIGKAVSIRQGDSRAKLVYVIQ